MSDFNSFRLRLGSLLSKSGMSKAELARKIDETPQFINSIFNAQDERANLPSANRVAKIADVFNVDLLWLTTGIGTPKKNVLTNDEKIINTDFIVIPEYKVTFGCGAENEPTYDEITDTAPATYRRDWFEKKGIDPRYCKKFQIHGVSMEPVIMNGDSVLIYEKVDNIEDGHIYALVYETNLMVKRLYTGINKLIIKSDNPNYQDEILSGDELNKIKILGKVIERSGSI